MAYDIDKTKKIKNESSLVSDAFIYLDKNICDIAIKEQKAIDYLTKQLDNADKDELLSLYNKFIKENFFKTENGIVFLYMLRTNLIRVFKVDEDKLLKIPAVKRNNIEKDKEINKELKHLRETYKKGMRYKNKFIMSCVIICILVVAIGGMFFILHTSNMPTIINYETKIQNKYSNWEEDLKTRENKIRKIEIKLNIKNKNKK